MTKIQALPGFMEVVEVNLPIVVGKCGTSKSISKTLPRWFMLKTSRSMLLQIIAAILYGGLHSCKPRKKPIPDQIKAAMDALLVGATKVRMIFYDPDTAAWDT